MNTRNIIRILIVIWIAVWALFLVRPYFKKGLWKEYSALMRLSLDDKRAFVAGHELYGFIRFASGSIGPHSSYKIIGLEDDPLSYRRAVYYLYPNIDREDPEFLLVYGKAGVSYEGYGLFKALTDDEYILRKI